MWCKSKGCPPCHKQAHLESRTEDQFHLSIYQEGKCTLQLTERILRQRRGNISSHQNLPVSSNPIPIRNTKTSSNHQVWGECFPEESGLSRCTNRMSFWGESWEKFALRFLKLQQVKHQNAGSVPKMINGRIKGQEGGKDPGSWHIPGPQRTINTQSSIPEPWEMKALPRSITQRANSEDPTLKYGNSILETKDIISSLHLCQRH